MPVQTIAKLLAALATAALLAACATQPTVSAQQESSFYRGSAHRTYTPPGPASDPWGPYISEASAKFDVPDRWIREVMHQESGGRLYSRNGDLITSGAGAMGLMQVMPATFDEIRARYPDLGADPYDPHNNILAGTAYLREMYDIYGSPGFLAAYNAGPGRLDDYLTRNRPLPEETRRYVAAIGPRLGGAEPRTPSPGQQFAMNAVPLSIPSGPRYASRYSAPVTGPILASADPAPTGFIHLNPPQPETASGFIRLNPPAPEPAPAPGGPYIVLRPQPPEDQQFASDPAPTPAVAQAFAPTFAEPALPEPPAYAPPPRGQQQLAAAALVPMAPRSVRFVTPASAEPIGAHHAGTWAVQVGALPNEGLATAATLTARDQARDLLGNARPSVTAVREPHGILYRARLTGLSHENAAQVCERLARWRTNCMVVGPDTQS